MSNLLNKTNIIKGKAVYRAQDRRTEIRAKSGIFKGGK
jgi:hypothetical protein